MRSLRGKIRMSNSGARAAVTASRNDCRSITSNKPGERRSESEMKVGCACWEKGKERASRRQQQHLCCTRKAPRVMEGARAGEEEEGEAAGRASPSDDEDDVDARAARLSELAAALTVCVAGRARAAAGWGPSASPSLRSILDNILTARRIAPIRPLLLCLRVARARGKSIASRVDILEKGSEYLCPRFPKLLFPAAVPISLVSSRPSPRAQLIFRQSAAPSSLSLPLCTVRGPVNNSRGIIRPFLSIPRHSLKAATVTVRVFNLAMQRITIMARRGGFNKKIRPTEWRKRRERS